MKACKIISYKNNIFTEKLDNIALEQILSIEIIWGKKYNRTHTLFATIIRTPGHDFELAIGLLFSLGIICSLADLISYSSCFRSKYNADVRARIILELDYKLVLPTKSFSPAHLRHSGCGMCTTAEFISSAPDITFSTKINPQIFFSCAQKLKARQELFAQTGGTHAAALFTTRGDLEIIYEDVGRHNALDKLIGDLIISHKINQPRSDIFLLLSSRASFELIQKAHMAQIPIVITIGAISSAALSYAQESKLTLVGFLRETSFNIYTHPGRIQHAGSA